MCIRDRASRVYVLRRSDGTTAATSGATSAPGDLAALTQRSGRIAVALGAAESRGDRRRAVSLRQRAVTVASAIDARRAGAQAVRTPTGAAREVVRTARTFAPPVIGRRIIARELDRAAQAPFGALSRAGAHPERLAPLAGLTPAEYLRQAPADRRAARAEIERELARRRALRRDLGDGRPTMASVAAAPAVPATEPAPIARRARQFGVRTR